jgi:hypothetical protein
MLKSIVNVYGVFNRPVINANRSPGSEQPTEEFKQRDKTNRFLRFGTLLLQALGSLSAQHQYVLFAVPMSSTIIKMKIDIPDESVPLTVQRIKQNDACMSSPFWGTLALGEHPKCQRATSTGSIGCRIQRTEKKPEYVW